MTWDDLPLVLLVGEFAKLMRRSPGTVLRDCRRGTIRPRPFAARPWRWYREDVRTYLSSAARLNDVTARGRAYG